MTPILDAQSTESNWPNVKFEALRTWYPSNACRDVDHALYVLIRKVSVSVRIMGL
mgnify:CR=1 FL=1